MVVFVLLNVFMVAFLALNVIEYWFFNAVYNLQKPVIYFSEHFNFFVACAWAFGTHFKMSLNVCRKTVFTILIVTCIFFPIQCTITRRTFPLGMKKEGYLVALLIAPTQYALHTWEYYFRLTWIEVASFASIRSTENRGSRASVEWLRRQTQWKWILMGIVNDRTRQLIFRDVT